MLEQILVESGELIKISLSMVALTQDSTFLTKSIRISKDNYAGKFVLRIAMRLPTRSLNFQQIARFLAPRDRIRPLPPNRLAFAGNRAGVFRAVRG